MIALSPLKFYLQQEISEKPHAACLQRCEGWTLLVWIESMRNLVRKRDLESQSWIACAAAQRRDKGPIPYAYNFYVLLMIRTT